MLTQLDYLWHEFETNEKAAFDHLKTTTNVDKAARSFMTKFERPRDQSEQAQVKRSKLAQAVLARYGNGAPGQAAGGSLVPPAPPTSACTNNPVVGVPVADIQNGKYAFPVALSKKYASNGHSWPCNTTGRMCHRGTPAMDIAKEGEETETGDSSGIPVIAITNGTIRNFKNTYNGIRECHQFQLVGEDGYWYWYGHIQGSSVGNNTKVQAGQQIAVIGVRKCTGNGSYPHLHIDRGFPKGRPGGSTNDRDLGFIPLMNALYELLPPP